MVYLDNASTTYPKPECVYAETMEQFRRFGVSPSRGCYSAARDMNKIVYSTRLSLAEMFKTIGTFPLGTVRFSPGHFTTDEDLSALDSALKVNFEKHTSKIVKK